VPHDDDAAIASINIGERRLRRDIFF